MPDIRYVVMSDMHLGAENSILTNLVPGTYEIDTTKASPVMIKMVECLKDLISKNTGTKKPTLVLNGDLMELALTTTNNASMAFQHFIGRSMPEDGERLFDNQIYFLAGNHDHNLWERSRNYEYIQYLKSVQPGEAIKDEIHSTTMFTPETIPENLLTVLVHRFPHLQDVNVSTVYPAHGAISDDKKKCVIVCHGHYVESMYSLMTSLRSKIFPDRAMPQTFQELETENYAWVDFFWSTLGRSGSVGKDINLIYDKLQDSDQVKIMIKNIAESLTDQKKNIVMRWIDKEVIQELLTLTLGRMAASERNEPDVELTPDATAGLKTLMEKYVINQFKAELDGQIPEDVSFIFGHTHKPFQRLMSFDGYANPVKVYNSGGWVVDTVEQQPLHGGSVILVDEDLDIVSLHFYKEGTQQVTVEELKNDTEKSSEFYSRLTSIIQMDQEPWAGFAAIAAAEIEIRHKNLAAIEKSNN